MTDGPVLAPELLRRLRARYGQPPRSYHSFEHAERVASLVAELGGDRACLLAAWFHDAVYDSGSTDNEERSAQLLLDWLGDDPDAARAAELVRMTADHQPTPGDEQAAILSDADLAVLGGTPEEYEAYRASVRAEYAQFDDAAWAFGRATVLEELLGRDRIFVTDAARQRWDEAARDNLRRELASLTR